MRTVREKQAKAFFGKDYADLDLVFSRPDGKPLDRRSVLRSFRTVLGKAKVRPQRFHDLRHHHETYLVLANVPVRVAQACLGHSSPTLRVYQHVLDGQNADAARAVEARLLGAVVSNEPS